MRNRPILLAVIAFAVILTGVFVQFFKIPPGVSVDNISLIGDQSNANRQIEVTLVNDQNSSFQVAGSNGIVTEFSIRDLDEMFIAGRSSRADSLMTVAPGKKIKLRFADYDLPEVVLLRLEIQDSLGRSFVILEKLNLGEARNEEKPNGWRNQRDQRRS